MVPFSLAVSYEKSVLSTAKNTKAPFFKNGKKEKTLLYNRGEKNEVRIWWIGWDKTQKKQRRKIVFLMGEIVLSYLIDFIILNSIKYSYWHLCIRVQYINMSLCLWLVLSMA